jgi:hypothetical protein
MRASQIVPKNPLKAQAQKLLNSSRLLSSTAKQQNAAQRVRKAQEQLANANKSNEELKQKLQKDTNKQLGT